MSAHPTAWQEIHRICGLPAYSPPTPEMVEAVSAEVLDARVFQQGKRLFPVQVDMILQTRMLGGSGIGNIGVGWGKGWLNVIIAQEHLMHRGARRALVFMPPTMFRPYFAHELLKIRRNVSVGVQLFNMHGKGPAQRKALATMKPDGITFIPYSLCSRPDFDDLIDLLEPDIVLLDEAQNVKDATRPKGKRLFLYLNERNPRCRLVAMSGTLTKKTIMEYWHVVARALGDLAPMPLVKNTAREWGGVLDAGSAYHVQSHRAGPIMGLVDWAQRTFPNDRISSDITGFRKAYSLRFNSTPGVAASGDADIGISLSVENRSPTEPRFELTQLMDGVAGMQAPTGEPLTLALEKWSWNYQLTSGFFYNLVWPKVDQFSQRRGISEDQAGQIIFDSKELHQATVTYNTLLSNWFKEHHVRGLDQGMLVGQFISQGGTDPLPGEIVDAWWHKKELTRPHCIERDHDPVFVCDYKMHAMADWVRSLKGAGGLIWYHHEAVGMWASWFLRQVDIPVLWCPAGDPYNEIIANPENAGSVIVASMRGHGTGKNLQHFKHNYFLQWPRDAALAQQVIGRTHRNGQDADHLVFVTNNNTEFDHGNMHATLIEASYQQQSLETRQALCSATFDPKPVEYPMEWLVAQGIIDPYGMRDLTEDHDTLMAAHPMMAV